MSLLYDGTLDFSNVDRFSQYALYGDIYKCNDCGFVVEKQSHDTLEIIEYLGNEKYGDEIIGQLNLQEKAKAYAPLVAIIERHRVLSHSTILDVGANTGIFLNLARELGARPLGLEPSREATAIAKSRFNLDIQNAVVADLDLADESLDIITLWDVVEHLYDPISDLAALLPKLKPGGYIFISTHNIENLFCRLLGKRNPLLMYQHFFHFSPSTLNRTLTAAGYDTCDVAYFRKSWSLRYLLALFDKCWPNSVAAKIAGARQPRYRPLRASAPFAWVFP